MTEAMKPARFRALDVFRGLTIAVMIVVNTMGAGATPFAILQHAPWFGFTVADVVFPSFLFAVGNAMSFAMKPGVSERDYLLKVARRTALIFLLGYLMYWFPFFHRLADGSWAFNPIGETRIMGVLQRIALCFGIAAVACRYLSWRWLLALSLGLLFGYWGVLMAFGQPGAQLTPLGNAAAMLDRAVLGLPHMYAKGHGYDPEGLLSTMPAIVNVIAGFLAGQYIRWFLKQEGDKTALVRRLAGAGLALCAAGLVWSLAFPLAKRIWTSSFVTLTVGIDLIVIALLIAYVEIWGQGRKRVPGMRFCEIFGRNPLAIYLFSELFVVVLQLIRVPPDTGLYDWIGIRVFQTVAPGPVGTLLCAIAYMLTCWLLAWALDRKNVIIKI
jgi:predicted acyltransferase